MISLPNPKILLAQMIGGNDQPQYRPVKLGTKYVFNIKTFHLLELNSQKYKHTCKNKNIAE